MVACVAWKGVPSHTAPSISALLALLKPERSMVLGKGGGITFWKVKVQSSFVTILKKVASASVEALKKRNPY